jgi:Mg-chelatase subunit ChlD
MPPAREATQTFLQELSASTLADRVGLVSFAHRARQEAPIADLDRRLHQLLAAAGALEAEPCGCPGGTNTGHGLEVALELFEHADQQGMAAAGLTQRMIILVSDGLANRERGQTDCVDRWIEGHQYALEVAGEAAEEGIRVHTITLGENGQFGQMREIAIRTGGRFLRAPRPEDLNDLFLVLARQVQVALVE